MFFLKQLFSSVSFPVASLYLFNQKLLKIKTTNWNPPNLVTVVIFKFMSLNELIWCYIKNDCCRNLSFRRNIFFGNDSSKRRWRCKSPFPYILCIAAGPRVTFMCAGYLTIHFSVSSADYRKFSKVLLMPNWSNELKLRIYYVVEP